MVARGDLGVELPPEDVPPLQNRIIASARQFGKPVVVATQMLESMISSPTPTRAEVSDVATAIYDGADAVMLSAESATGEYPCEAVQMMDRIASSVERDPVYPARIHFTETKLEPTTADALAGSARQIASTVSATGDGLLHKLRIDRAADRPRTAVGADPGDEPPRRSRRGGSACCGASTRSTPAMSRASRKWSQRPSGWRFATTSPRAGTGWC